MTLEAAPTSPRIEKKIIQPRLSDIQLRKQKADRFIRLLTGRGFTEAEQHIKQQIASENPYDPRLIIERMPLTTPTGTVSTEVTAAIQARIAPLLSKDQKISWLIHSPEEIQYNPQVALFAERIASAGELQNDPAYLMYEGARLYNSVSWADLSDEAAKETREVLKRVHTKVNELRLEQGTLREIPENTIKYFLIPEARMGQMPIGPPSPGAHPGWEAGLGGQISAIESMFDPTSQTYEHIQGYKSIVQDTSLRPQDRLFLLRHSIEDDIRILGKNASQEQVNALRLLSLRTESTIHDLSARGLMENVPDQIRASQREIADIIANPIAAMDKQLSKILRDLVRSDNPQASVELRRLELQYQWLFSDEYVDYQIGRLPVIDVETGVDITGDAIAARQRLHDQFGEQIKKFGDTFNRRLNGAYFRESNSNSATIGDQRFQGIINGRLKEEDYLGQDGDYNGLVGYARQIMHAKLEAHLRNQDGEFRIILPEELKEIREETIRTMQKLEPLLGDRYRAYLDGVPFMDDPHADLANNPIHILRANTSAEDLARVEVSYENACESIVGLADTRMLMWMDEVGIDIRGLGSGTAATLGSDAYQSYLRKAKYESLKKPIDFGVMEWGNQGEGKPAADKIFYRNMGKLWRNASPEIPAWAEERAGKVWEKLELLKHGSLPDKDKSRLLGEIRDTFFFNPELEHIIGLGDKDPEFSHWIHSLSKKDLQEEMSIRLALDIAQSHMVRPYSPLESFWRTSTIDTHIQNTILEALKVKYPDMDYSQDGLGIFTVRRVVKASNDYFMSKTSGDPIRKREIFVNELAKVAKYRPQGLTMALFDRDSNSFSAWFTEKNAQYNLGYKHAGELLHDVSMRFDLINTEILNEGLLPIDYSRGLNQLSADDPRRRIIDSVFSISDLGGKTNLNRDQYFAVMGDMTTYLLGDARSVKEIGFDQEKGNVFERVFGKKGYVYRPKFKALEELADIRYDPLLTTPRWDDTPFTLLENPERIAGLRSIGERKAQETGRPFVWIRLSDKFSSAGSRESDGMMRRVYRDWKTAEEAKGLLASLMRPSQEIFLKNVDQIYPMINSYQGPDHAAMCVVAFEGAWGMSARVYDGYGPLLENLKDSSDFKKYHDPTFKSMSVDELREFVEEVQGKTSVIKHNAHKAEGLLESSEESQGITNWRKVLGGRGGWAERLVGPENKEKFDKILEKMNEFVPSGVLMRVKVPLGVLMFLGLLAIFTFTEVTKKKSSEHGEEH